MVEVQSSGRKARAARVAAGLSLQTFSRDATQGSLAPARAGDGIVAPDPGQSRQEPKSVGRIR
jgi:hypothetical protein